MADLQHFLLELLDSVFRHAARDAGDWSSGSREDHPRSIKSLWKKALFITIIWSFLGIVALCVFWLASLFWKFR
jgi:hypothetical protein